MTTHTTRRALIGGAGLVAVAGSLAVTSQAKSAALPAVDRTAWDQAFKAMTIATAEDDANAAGFDVLHDAADKETQDILYAEFERLGEVRYDATWELFALPAPDHAALLWKTEYLFGDDMAPSGSSPSWAAHVMDWYMADQRRLLASGAR